MSRHGDNRNIRVLQFLDAYEKQESLWNPAMESYKNKSARDEAYMNIIRDLNVPSLTIHDIKLKVKSIRTTYTKELRLLIKHKEENKPYSPKLFWFNRANCFLKNVSLARDKGRAASCSEKNQSDEYKPCAMEYITDVSHRQNIDEDLHTDITAVEDETGNSTSTTYEYKLLRTADLDSNITQNDMDVGNTQPEEVTTSSKQTQNEYQSHIATSIDSTKLTTTATEAATAATNILVTSNNSTTGSNIEDEYDIFCRSVAAQLRCITDAYSRSVAKLKIQQILFEAETGHYRNNPCITIPVSQQINNL